MIEHTGLIEAGRYAEAEQLARKAQDALLEMAVDRISRGYEGFFFGVTFRLY